MAGHVDVVLIGCSVMAIADDATNFKHQQALDTLDYNVIVLRWY